MRLDKYLSDMGIATRSESKKIIKAGRITIDGEVITDPAFHVFESNEVSVDGESLSYQKHIYYMLNKPQGVITATKDNSKKTILDLIKEDDKIRELFPVGRLDKDTEGLLLITDDGALAHELLSPKKHVDKTYRAIVTGEMTAQDVDSFASDGLSNSLKKSLDRILIRHSAMQKLGTGDNKVICTPLSANPFRGHLLFCNIFKNNSCCSNTCGLVYD